MSGMSPAAKPRIVVTEQALLVGEHDETSSFTSRRASPSASREACGLVGAKNNNSLRSAAVPWGLKRTKSGCSLANELKHGWKPVTLGPIVLIAFAGISLCLVAIIEVLAQQSQIVGGLALSPSPDDFPTLVSFSYLFLPTIIAVIYSLFWSWIDLDAKRMQPWFEMSRKGGQTARDSVLLTYPYDFVGTAPFRAFKRRHWPAFISGTTMVIIFWLLTPLQSGILGTGSVVRDENVDMGTTATFYPLSEQAERLDQSILNEGYAITWLNQPYPPFTTPDYTIIPFEPLGPPTSPTHTSAKWTGRSTKYWTDLSCWPAQISRHGPENRRTFDFLDGRGCNASDIAAYGSFDGKSPYKMFYLGYQSSPFGDYALAGPSCPNVTNRFLAIWSRHNATIDEARPNDIRLQAVFCETAYLRQEVQVTVSSDTLAPIKESVVPVGAPEQVTDSEFNITAFEYLVGAGVSPVELQVQREYPFGRLLEQYPQAVELGMTWPMSPMVGFAIAGEGVTSLDVFDDEERLARAFSETHKRIFSLALRRLSQNSTAGSSVLGSVEYELHGVIVSRLYSAVVEGLLSLVAIFSLLLCWHCYKAPSNLGQDPASLGDMIDICRNSPALLKSFAGKGCVTEETLARALRDLKVSLHCGCQSHSGQMAIEVTRNPEFTTGDDQCTIAIREHSSVTTGHYTPVRHWALRRPFGSAIILIMVAVVILLSYFKQEEQARGGLAAPNTSFEGQQILLSFLPTIFATALEPFWVLLNRLLCLLQPFSDLWSGRRPAKGSINARYTSVPPQLVFWRALGARHFLLAAICAVAVLSNVLAVGLGGLFNQLPVPVTYGKSFEQRLLPRLRNETLHDNDFLPRDSGAYSYDEPFFVVMNNVSQGTPLPPWIGESYFFQPFTLPNETGREVETFTAKTRGFGVTPDCSSAGKHRSSGVGPVLNLTLTRMANAVPGCQTSFQPESLSLDHGRYTPPEGASSAEVVDIMSSDTDAQICQTALIMGWSRSSQADDLAGEMESSFVVCKPVFTTAMFDVTVDREGYVLDSDPRSELETALDYSESTNHTDTMTILLNKLIIDSQLSWHNDSFSRDWMNYLLKIRPGHADILDPATSVPDPNDLIPSIEAVYRQLFALTLGLNDEVFERSEEPSVIEGTEQLTEERVFMPLPAFIISISVLGLDIIAAILLYGFGVSHFLPRMPTTIGSVLAYMAPSRAVRETMPEDRRGKTSKTFSFGRYVGDDGRAHVGIELDPLVVPVQLSALKNGDTKPKGSLLRRVFARKRTPSSGDTWL